MIAQDLEKPGTAVTGRCLTQDLHQGQLFMCKRFLKVIRHVYFINH